MKMVLFLVCLFFLSFAVRSRELTFQEKMIVSSLEKTDKILETFYADIDPRRLNFRDRLSLATHRRGCVPVKSAIEVIKRSEDNLEDQSQLLIPLMLTCQQSALNLTDMYLVQRDQ